MSKNWVKNMKSRFFFILLALVVVSGGCFNRPKQRTPEIAADVEESFKQKWIAKRMGELQASGVTDAREARRQATDEFRKKFEYIKAAHTPESVGSPSTP